MMGPRQEAQAALFYEFSLEDHVPQDHLLRSIDRFVDLGGIRKYLADFYSHTGRPSVDPELLIRVLLVGYCFGIRSERRLCEEVHLNLAYRWFCRLDLNDRVPDHSTFSKNRHGRFRESELLRHLFKTTVARCIEEGLVSGQRMAIDASLIEADANKQNSTPKEEWDAASIDPADVPRAVREYLDTLDEAAFGAASEVQPKFTSHSDPASQCSAGWLIARLRHTFLSSTKPADLTAHGPAPTAENDQYICPERHALKPFRRNYSDPNRGPKGKGVARYRALKQICQACPSKAKCCPNADARKITREENEDARQVARDIDKTRQYDISMKLRKKVEMLFAHLKRILGLGRLRLRGPCGASYEFLLTATAQNLCKLAKSVPAPQ